MAENKTRPTEIAVAAFLATIPDETRRTDALALADLMQTATGQEPKMWGPAIVGFGSYHYTYASGREGHTMLVGFSPRKAALVLYGIHASETLLATLGKHTVGKGCLYIKRLADIDPTILKSIIASSFESRA